MVTDFGKAFFNHKSAFLGPENEFTYKNDIWALGLIFYSIFTGEHISTEKALNLINDDILVNPVYVPYS